MIPKADSPSLLADLARRAVERCPLIPVVETAAGTERAAEVCAIAGAVRVALGNADLAAELGIDPDDHTALTYARTRLVFASAAANLAPPIDGVTISIEDTDALHAGHRARLPHREVVRAQVAPVTEGFAPFEGERTWAREVVAAAGSVTRINGQMIDKPVLERARRILAAGGGQDARTDSLDSKH